MNLKYVLLIHAGCEDIVPENFTRAEEEGRLQALRECLIVGKEILHKGGQAIDAVEAVVRNLEDSPLFNAGRGSVFTQTGKNEMDASIMNGRNLQAGAVAGTTNIKNPVSAARLVMENSEYVLLISAGAEKFATEQDLEKADPSYFHTCKRWDEYLKANSPETQSSFKTSKCGTVGAVCLDRQGNLAAASSTGGTTNKKSGRVGDSPVVGAGIYANNATCAVSCTGQGEYFMRLVAAHRVSLLMELQKSCLEEAAAEVLKKIQNMGGEGGLIAVDRSGQVAMPFVTQGMFRGMLKESSPPRVAMYGPPGTW